MEAADLGFTQGLVILIQLLGFTTKNKIYIQPSSLLLAIFHYILSLLISILDSFYCLWSTVYLNLGLPTQSRIPWYQWLSNLSLTSELPCWDTYFWAHPSKIPILGLRISISNMFPVMLIFLVQRLHVENHCSILTYLKYPRFGKVDLISNVPSKLPFKTIVS